jgi:UDP-glucose 4-epimerase
MRAVVTGGAGFIGSNVVEQLVARGDEVVIVDDLCTGFRENVHPEARFLEGTVSNADLVADAVQGAELVVHLAAHRAVLRSVEQPLTTDTANTHGTLTVLDAARTAGVRRVVYASSSSVYGGRAPVPTPESAPLLPRSPYAVTKLAGEHYCRVFSELFGLETVALRFFNVFGPRQRPDSQYAAVIPLFIEALAAGKAPVVHGDGQQSRDFTYISDVVRAVMAAAETPAERCSGKVYNVACNHRSSLLELLDVLGELLGSDVEPEFTAPRPGDVTISQADVSAIAADLGWKAEIGFREGLARTVEWFSNR